MVSNRKGVGKTVSIPGGLAVGAAVSLITTVLGAAIVAKLADSQMIEESAMDYGAGAILLISSFFAAMTAYGRIKRQRATVCMISALIYFLMLLSMTALFFGGQYAGVGVSAGLIAAGGGCAVLLGLGKGSRKGPARYKIPRH